MTNYLVPIFADASIYFLLSLSLWITFRICRFPDLALEQWFVFGGALYVFSVRFSARYNIFILLVSLLAVSLTGGAFCSILRNKGKVHAIILSLSIALLLYTVSLFVMGSSNSFIPKQLVPSYEKTAIVATSIFIIITLFLWVISKTRTGLLVLTAGSNWGLAKRHHLKPTLYQGIGLAVGFLLSMVSGALYSWRSTNADLSYGQGVLISTIFIVVYTSSLLQRISIIKNSLLLAAVTFAYTGMLTIIQEFGVPPQANRALMAIALILLVISIRKKSFSQLSFS